MLGVPTYSAVTEIPEAPTRTGGRCPPTRCSRWSTTARRALRGLLVVSSGYAEIGPEGAERQRTWCATRAGTACA